MPVRIRSLRPDEWRTYRAVRLAALRDAPEAFGGTYADSLALPERDWRERCDQPAWFALDGGEAVGMVRTWRHPDKELPELISMWVGPGGRGRGVGDLLVQAVADWARQSGAELLRLAVVPGNGPATGLYRRNGFELTEELGNALPDDQHEQIMVKRLSD